MKIREINGHKYLEELQLIRKEHLFHARIIHISNKHVLQHNRNFQLYECFNKLIRARKNIETNNASV